MKNKDWDSQNRFYYEEFFAEDGFDYDGELDYKFMFEFLEFLANQPGGKITISRKTAEAWGLLDENLDEDEDIEAGQNQRYN